MVRQINIKKRLLRVFFAIELLVFATAYFFGPQGLHALYSLHEQNDRLRVEVMELRDEVESLHRDIDTWEGNSFQREKIAREQLQMARPDETIYILD